MILSENRLHFSGSCVGHELHQRAVGIAEIDAGARTLGAEALHRPALDANTATIERGDGIGDRPYPFEAQVAVARCHRQPLHLRGLAARAMNVELLVAET